MTAVIAVHCAYPTLCLALLGTLYVGLLIGLLLSPAAIIAIFASPTKGAQLDVARNPFFKWFFRAYLLILGVVYLLLAMAAIFYDTMHEALFA